MRDLLVADLWYLLWELNFLDSVQRATALLADGSTLPFYTLVRDATSTLSPVIDS